MNKTIITLTLALLSPLSQAGVGDSVFLAASGSMLLLSTPIMVSYKVGETTSNVFASIKTRDRMKIENIKAKDANNLLVEVKYKDDTLAFTIPRTAAQDFQIGEDLLVERQDMGYTVYYKNRTVGMVPNNLVDYRSVKK